MAPPKKRQRRTITDSDDDEEVSADVFTTTSASETTQGAGSGDDYVPPTPKKAANGGSKKQKTAPTTPRKAAPKKNGSTTTTPMKNKPKAPSMTPTPKSKKIVKPVRSTTASPAKKGAANKVSKPQRGIASFFAKPPPATKKGSQKVQLTQRRPSSFEEDDLDDVIESDFSDSEPLFEKLKSSAKVKKEPSSMQSASKPHWPPTFSAPAPKPVPDLPADPRTWAEKHAPQTTAELAVHKKKIEDLRDVLERIFVGVSQKRLVILSGPSGSGKTATIQALANELDYEILEWRNPTGHEFGRTNRTGVAVESLNAQFDEFVNRGAGYGQLRFSTTKHADMDDEMIKDEPPDSDDDSPRRKILLIEDLPNIFASSQSSALTAFRQTLHSFMATQQSLTVTPTPCVLIISEALSTQAHSHSITPHRLLGPQLLSHNRVISIQFNKIAPTIIQKSIEKIAEVEARRMGMRTLPSKGLLAGLGLGGDIRSAVNALEFMMVGGDGGNWSASVNAGPASFRKAKEKKERGMKGWGEPSEGERSTLEMITQRETSLGIFHAVGRVIYNKRLTDPQTPSSSFRLNSTTTINNPPPPEHLLRHYRAASIVDIPNLLDSIGTDVDTFVSAVHENYLPSCQGYSFLESMERCSENLSDSDILLCAGTASRNGKGDGLSHIVSVDSFGSMDAMRSLEFSFQVAVRGVLHGLPSPVKRDPGRTKIYYPMALRLWRERETVEGLISMFASGRNGLTTAAASTFGAEGGIARPGDTEGLGGGTAATREAITDTLPYLYKILKGPTALQAKPMNVFQRAALKKSNSNSSTGSTSSSGWRSSMSVSQKTLRNIEKVVLFRGVGDQSEQTPDELGLESLDEDSKALPAGEEDEFGNVKTERKMKRLREQGGGSSGQYGSRFRRRKDGGVSILGALEDESGRWGSKDKLEEDVDKLVLTDDDIEDFD